MASSLEKRIEAVERVAGSRQRTAVELSDAELMAIVLHGQFGRMPRRDEVADALTKFNALSDSQISLLLTQHSLAEVVGGAYAVDWSMRRLALKNEGSKL